MERCATTTPPGDRIARQESAKGMGKGRPQDFVDRGFRVAVGMAIKKRCIDREMSEIRAPGRSLRGRVEQQLGREERRREGQGQRRRTGRARQLSGEAGF
jgi:hypothetical protein